MGVTKAAAQSSELCCAPGDTELPHTGGRGMEEWHSALVTGVRQATAPQGTLSASTSLSSERHPPLSPHIVSCPRSGEQNLLPRAPWLSHPAWMLSAGVGLSL